MTRRPPERFFRKFMLYWLPVLAYITVIIFLSAQPNLLSRNIRSQPLRISRTSHC